MRDSRYIKEVCINVVSETPLRVGNGKNEMDILVDKATNNPMIMGSSIAGAFRNFLYSLKEVDIDKLFGSERSDDGSNSKIYVSDAIGDKLEIHNRVGIKRDDEYGTTNEGSIYNATYLNSGVGFEFKLKIFATTKKELELFDKYIRLCIKGIINSNIRFGSKKTAGFGIFGVSQIKSRYFNLSDNTDLKEYILNNREFDIEDLSDYKNIENNINYVNFKFRGSIKDSMIIKSKNPNSEIDCESMNYGDSYIIPGTIIKGLCRSYSKKILNTLKIDISILEKLYGPESNNKSKESKAIGRVYSQDVHIQDVRSCVYNRIKIDRFTGGVIEGAKFDEERINGNIEFEINFKKTEDEKLNDNCIAMISLFLRDLALSKVVIGSSGNIGSGRLIGEKVIVTDVENIAEFRFDDGKVILSNDKYINEKINSLIGEKGAN